MQTPVGLASQMKTAVTKPVDFNAVSEIVQTLGQYWVNLDRSLYTQANLI
jgi:hypothetical protein